jgi:hypothetical protein
MDEWIHEHETRYKPVVLVEGQREEPAIARLHTEAHSSAVGVAVPASSAMDLVASKLLAKCSHSVRDCERERAATESEQEQLCQG